MKTRIVINDSRESFGVSRKGLLSLYENGFPLDHKPLACSGYRTEDFEPVSSELFPGLKMHCVYPVLLTDDGLLEAASVESCARLRSHPALVRMVEELGFAASCRHCRFRIEELPAGVPYRIVREHGYERLDVFNPSSYVLGFMHP